MARKHRPEHHEEHADETWLVPYSDILTLLLAMFIVLFASAQIDQKKFDQLSQSFNIAFSGSPALFDHVQTPPQQTMGQPRPEGIGTSSNKAEDLSKAAAPPDIVIKPDTSYVQETLQMIELKKMMDQYIDKNGLAGQMETSLSEDGLLIRIKDTALFDSGQAAVKPTGYGFAAELAKMMMVMQQRVFVSGHTDNMPINTAEFPSNWDLSTRRSLNFMKAILHEGGNNLRPARFSVAGFGEYQPIATNDTEEGRAKNRRVEILIARSHPVRTGM